MANDLTPNVDNREIIRVHNAFVNAIFTLSADAKKLLLTIWLHTNGDGKNIKIYRGDISKKVGIDLKNLNTEHREKIIEELMRTIITIRDIENPNNFVKIQLLGKTKYKNGILFTNIDEDLLPYIQEAQEKLFTRFKIQNIKPLTSIYAIRIYLMLKQYEDTGWREIELSEFRKMLEIEHKYKRAYDFKKYVLEVAKKQINENTDIEIDYELIKKGRTYKKIKFKIKSKNKNKQTEQKEQQQQHIKKQVKEKETPHTDFKAWRAELIKKGNIIIQLNDKNFELKTGFLFENGKLLNKEKAFDAWSELYEHKDKIKIIEDIEKFEKEKELDEKERIKREIEELYSKKIYKYLTIKNGEYIDIDFELLSIKDIKFTSENEVKEIIWIALNKKDKKVYNLQTTINQLKQYTK